jgi:hypothetical protein
MEPISPNIRQGVVLRTALQMERSPYFRVLYNKYEETDYEK